MSLTDDQWLQASLPVRNGGLGKRRVSSLASSAFPASAAGTRGQDRILSRVISINDDVFDKCLSTRISNGIQPPVDSDMHKQRKWDKTAIDAEFNHLLSHYSEPYCDIVQGFGRPLPASVAEIDNLPNTVLR